MRMMGYIDANENPMPFVLQMFQGLEILHLPLMAFMVVHSFDRIFYRWPSTTSLIMAAMTAFFADFLLIFCLVVFYNMDRPLNDVVSIFILIYGILFMFSLLPLFRETQQCWILHIIMFAVVMYWELIGLGVAAWDLAQNSYPVPGSMATLVYIFHSPALDEDEEPPKQYDVIYNLTAKDSKQEQERVETSIIWHVGAQVTERVALLKMFGKPNENNDCVICLCNPVTTHLHLLTILQGISITNSVLWNGDHPSLFLCVGISPQFSQFTSLGRPVGIVDYLPISSRSDRCHT